VRPVNLFYFDERPPQWCIVDKWFSMGVLCTDRSIKELEAVVYNTDNEVVKDVEPEVSNVIHDKRVVVSLYEVPKTNLYRAVFRMRFVNGSKGAWLHIGIHKTSEEGPLKCLLKSPPIKVQTNRSKRPRDTKKRATPVVSSLSPSSVPSTGNFPGRNDRMLLIFGCNFYLWGRTPVIQLCPQKENGQIDFDPRNTVEIRPPNLIWWSENLLECQLPECCAQNIIVRVSNYDGVYGEGKMLKVSETPGASADDSRLLDLSKPLGSIVDYQQLTNSHLLVDFTPVAENKLKNKDGNNDEFIKDFKIKVVVYVKNDKECVLAYTENINNNNNNNNNTNKSAEKIPLEDIAIILRIIDNKNKNIIKEVRNYKNKILFLIIIK